MTFADTMKLARTAGVTMVMSAVSGAAMAQTVDPALLARMDKEKAARQACKIDICKAFAAPTQGAPIVCDVTKTWLRDDITARIVGGSYVWGYGHMQCNLKLNLDRAAMGSALAGASGKVEMPEHKMTCHVGNKDPAKSEAFKVEVSLTPKATFENGKAKAVSLQPVKAEGSTVASAAVTSIMAVDKVSGLVSRATANEINSFLFDKCKADGVTIAERK